MREQIDRINKMVNEGKITPKQGERLINALKKPSVPKRRRQAVKFLMTLIEVFVIGILAIFGYILVKTPQDFQAAPNRTRKESMPTGITEYPRNYLSRQGEMLIPYKNKKLALPLLHTDVTGEINGFLARVNVTQTFINPMDSAIEATYVFPLPHNAAVDSMIMHIGARRIKGIIKERGEARAIYERARREGRTASLLEQERPNIFTQSVANIMPSDTIRVLISYVQELKFRDAKFFFDFPMVVGPRYIPGRPLRPESRGMLPPTDQVPDAHRITPPVLAPGTRGGHDISLSVVLNPGAAIRSLTSSSHRIEITEESDSVKRVQLSASDKIPNKDFMLEYSISANDIKPVFLTHRQKKDGFFQLILLPQAQASPSQIFARELVFVVDNSGSMRGHPIAQCRAVMSHALNHMRHDDVFRLMKFSGSADMFSPGALKATPQNIKEALAFVENMRGGGGTEMMKAINAMFDAPRLPGRQRIILFMTDGYVGNDAAIIRNIRVRVDTCRVFSLGVGSSVNRHLLEGMALAGRGMCRIIRPDADAKETVNEFYSLIDAPVLTGISLAWEGVAVSENVPSALPDLFSGQPVVVTGRYGAPGRGSVTVRGSLPRGKTYRQSLEIELPGARPENGVIKTLWARKKIAEIELFYPPLYSGSVFGADAYAQDQVKEDVTRLGLEYRIMTQYTSFVAVDDAVRNKSGKWVIVEQPVELPESMSPEGVRHHLAGASRGMMSMMVGAAGALRMKAKARIGGSQKYVRNFEGVTDHLSGLSAADQERRAQVKLTPFEQFQTEQLAGRDKKDVYRVIMMHLGGIRAEYNRRLREVPGVRGALRVSLVIDKSGSVITCKVVRSTLKDKQLENVLIKRIKAWRFDACDSCGKATVTFLLAFKTAN